MDSRPRALRSRLPFVVLVLAAALAAPGASARAVTDADVRAAREAFQRANVPALEAARRQFAGHLLEPYPAYWLLASRIARADPAEVRAFLARWPDGPLAESLRRDWLKAQGAAGAWDEFRAVLPSHAGEDPDIACFAFQERLVRQDPEVIAEARSLFLAGREAPPSCDPVFAALADGKHVNLPETWSRIRQLLAAGAVRDAKRANALLPSRIRIAESAIDRAQADPARYLAGLSLPLLGRGPAEVALHAVGRLARSRPEEAAERLQALSARLAAEDVRFAWGQIALNAAMIHHTRALEWYELAGDATLTDHQLAWKARAGLRASDWNAVFSAIQALSPLEARDSGWRYWRARALRAKGQPEAADALLRTLSRQTDFYGLLAAEELGVLSPPDWTGRQPRSEDIDRVRALPGIQRALALYRADLGNEGFREWFWAVKSLEDRELLAASELARQANLPDRAINTSERTLATHDFTQRYPLPHREALTAAARQWEANEAWLYGIIRQESRFMTEARSRAGALGLMQLMPATARWVARQIPIAQFRAPMLTQPDTNVQMGTYYFKRVLGELGDPVLATAAYNAGPGRARRWREATPLEGAIYAETIPFNETRDYVKKVLANTWYYTHRITGQTVSLRALLGRVPARGPHAAQALAAEIP